MNESGPPTLGVATFYKVPPARILAVVDDLDLPFARLRLRADGSSGGHNGLKSLIEAFGEAFPRLRVGIGRDRETGEAIRHVLGASPPRKPTRCRPSSIAVSRASSSWLRGDMQGALNRVNASNAPTNAKRNDAEEPKDG